jgi:hypothetical protein
MDYLAELADAYLQSKKKTGKPFEALDKALDSIPGYAAATQMGRELTIKLLHEEPTLAVNVAKEINYYPLFIERLADDILDWLANQSRSLRLQVQSKRYTNWLISDDVSPRPESEIMRGLVEERKEILARLTILETHGLTADELYEYLVEPGPRRPAIKLKLMGCLLGRRELVDQAIDLTRAAVPFTLMLKRELEDISTVRQAHGFEGPQSAAAGNRYPPWHALEKELVGLSLSGGGIRSATFNLGVLQGLAELNLLSRIDYISTVSGGGYIGAWLAGRILRETAQRIEAAQAIQTADAGQAVPTAPATQAVPAVRAAQGAQAAQPVQALESAPAAGTVQPIETVQATQAVRAIEASLSLKQSPNPALRDGRPIQFLREYSNYLTPRTGFFSADTWTMGVTWLRNTLLNQLILVIALAGLLLIPRVIHEVAFPAQAAAWKWDGGIALICVFIWCVGGNLSRVGRIPNAAGQANPSKNHWLTVQSRIQVLAVLPLLLLISLAVTRFYSVVYSPPGWWIPAGLLPHGTDAERHFAWICCLFGAACALVLFLVGTFGGYERCMRERSMGGSRALAIVTNAIAIIGSLFTGAAVAFLAWFWAKLIRSLALALTPGWFLPHLPDSVRHMAFGSVLIALCILALLTAIGELWRFQERRRGRTTGPSHRKMLKNALAWALGGILGVAALWFVGHVYPDRYVPAWFPADPGSPERPVAFLLWLTVSILFVFSGYIQRLADELWFAGENGKKLAQRVLTYSLLGMAVLLASAAGAGLLWLAGSAFFAWAPQKAGEWHVLTFGPPLVILLISLIVALHLGILGSRLVDYHREWWSRFIAWCMIYSLAWLALFTVSVYVPLLYASSMAATREWAISGLSATWAIATAVGVLAARSPRTSGKPQQTQNGNGQSAFASAVSAAAPYVFIVGLLTAVSVSLEQLLRGLLVGGVPDWNSVHGAYWGDLETIQQSLGSGLMWTALGCLALSYFISTRVDLNEFSMHNFYRNRLVRCYLGASRLSRLPDNFIQFDESDEILLKDLTVSNPSRPYMGPYPILNTALNLVAGGELAWQERRAASFVFTPRYCGYDVRQTMATRLPDRNAGPEAYRPTEHYAYPDAGPSLGIAMSISGAAASPNSGATTSAASSFLMTVFNARLGWWLGNPRKERWWQSSSPGAFGLFYLFNELTGGANDESWYVNLSDGGHFENLGVYELVRRHCRYIVVCDAGQDGAFALEDLGNAIRKCRVDFGVEIEMRLDQIRDVDANRNSRSHCAVGTIRYPNAPAAVREGKLVYLKSSITGDEDFDVLEYHRRVPAFPHETTADQWFNESQFESYRSLGRHIALTTFTPAGRTAADGGDSPNGTPWNKPEYFQTLGKHWYRPSENFEKKALKHAEIYAEIMERLRKLPGLSSLDYDLFGKIIVEPGSLPRELNRDSFYVVNSLIQLMENVYADLDLEHEWDHPRIEGWRSAFQRWANSPSFHKVWEISRATYSSRFQRFYEDRLTNADRVSGS